ncbi:ribosomal protein S17 [Wolffia australiana]
MFATALLQAPTTSKLQSSPFLKGSPPLLSPPKPSSPQWAPPSLPLTVRAMRSLQGRVVSTVSDKTVGVEVTRLAPHPKYKRRIRMKKTYQAHDPENRFKVGDFVQLEKSRPISKTKTFLAVPAPGRNAPLPAEDAPQDLGLPLQSQS